MEQVSLTNAYATTLYNWLNKIAPTYREPLQSLLFKNKKKPDEYITYSCSVGNFNTEFIQPISIYSHSTAFTKLGEIVDKIQSDIKECGLKLKDEWGYITIYKGTPFYQDKPEEDENWRAGYINLLVRVYQYDVV